VSRSAAAAAVLGSFRGRGSVRFAGGCATSGVATGDAVGVGDAPDVLPGPVDRCGNLGVPVSSSKRGHDGVCLAFGGSVELLFGAVASACDLVQAVESRLGFLLRRC
jgi:hypothetical protein